MWSFMITCYIMMLSNFLIILLTGLMGYFKFTVWGAAHAPFAVFAIIVFILTETLVMFFFIATGKSIKQMIRHDHRFIEYWEQTISVKKQVFPQIILTIILIGILFIHGGVIDNDLPFSWLHGPLFILAFLQHTWSLIIKNRSFRQQVNIAAEISKQLE